MDEKKDHQRVHIERAIERARNGVGDRIDELDQELRQRLDFKSMAAEHAPQIMGAGAAVGFLIGFGFPKPLRRLVGLGIPLAMIAVKVRAIQAKKAAESTELNPS